MKQIVVLLAFTTLFFACKNEKNNAWEAFTKCGTNRCVKEALDVKDALIKNPEQTLLAFHATYEKGNDHVIGWLYLLRDSVLTNQKMGDLLSRIAMQQSVMNAVKPFIVNAKMGETAKVVFDGMDSIVMIAETEDIGETVEPSDIPITGTYDYTIEKITYGELKISQLSSEKFKFAMDLTTGPPAHNQGSLEDIGTFKGQNEGIFSMNKYDGECAFSFIFYKDSVTVETTKGGAMVCGFGNRVMADGVFRRKSFDDPFLSKKDAATATNLQGTWQSADDPKSSIKIANGNYSEMYEGQTPVPIRYIYFPTCPKDCNPVAKMPCLKIIGQDEICYTIVKADGKTLELSQIGGTGNTNKYVRKK